MGTKKHTTEQIVSILRQYEVEMASGKSIEEISRTVIAITTFSIIPFE